MRGLAGRVAIVTGASSGIGRATAEVLSARGVCVICVARGAERLETVVNGLERAVAVVEDVAAEGASERIVAAAERVGGADFLVANAALDGQGTNVLDLELAHWRRLLEVNLTAVFSLGQLVARRLVDRSVGGSIVNVASINGISAEQGFADYNSSKSAVIQLSRTMAIDLAGHGIRVNAVCPGYVRTEMTATYLADREIGPRIAAEIPFGRVGEAPEIAEAIAFLLSDNSGYTTGSVVTVDGGRTAGWKGAV